eukprot:TRINITY_DN6292_c0_g3_i2.p1 TRINITY_DN6292_c0_g3~~TRINITY_DN6292_c0_g3_i2.p1  ORF type:complete len:193 (+),score=66.82 TRINITY_DN6292_c0_g3_i2:58-636(+)
MKLVERRVASPTQQPRYTRAPLGALAGRLGTPDGGRVRPSTRGGVRENQMTQLSALAPAPAEVIDEDDFMEEPVEDCTLDVPPQRRSVSPAISDGGFEEEPIEDEDGARRASEARRERPRKLTGSQSGPRPQLDEAEPEQNAELIGIAGDLSGVGGDADLTGGLACLEELLAIAGGGHGEAGCLGVLLDDAA